MAPKRYGRQTGAGLSAKKSKAESRAKSATSGLKSRRRLGWAGAALIVVVTTLAYLPALRGDFIFDDDLYLTGNNIITASDGLYRFWFTTQPLDYYPVSNSTLWLEWRLWGVHSTGYHATNLGLHVIEALLIWMILRKLSMPGAFLAALLFAVHPVNVESVAWIAQRKDMVAMLFFLLSLLWYLKAETVRSAADRRLSRTVARRWYGMSLVAFVLAMLSKGSVAVLPALLLIIIWWVRPLTRRDLLRTVPFFIVSALLIPVNMWFQARNTDPSVQAGSFTERLLSAGGVVWFYLYKAILPVKLILVYPQWHIQTNQLRWWLPLLTALIATFFLWRHRRSWSRPLFFAWAYFCVALAPVWGFARVGFMQHSLVADHYQHVALVGVTTLAGAGWATWRTRVRGKATWGVNAIAVAVVGALTVLTWKQSSLYADRLVLYRTTLAGNPDSWMIQNDLGAALLQAGQSQEAIEHYRRALSLRPDYAEAHNNLGVALDGLGKFPEAIEQYESALRVKPDYRQAHNNLGTALYAEGRLEEAVEHYKVALQWEPDSAEVHNNLAIALAGLNRPKEAIEQFQETLRLNPNYPSADYNVRVLLSMEGEDRRRAR